ncbi:MAG: hypothetical protein RBR86_10175 [Pseudobdellovibrionaceae bacterium]|jgi:hypothetical protein|nr:hypothetical protein [Pseudobdellovibrionaceae bacterium]
MQDSVHIRSTGFSVHFPNMKNAFEGARLMSAVLLGEPEPKVIKKLDGGDVLLSGDIGLRTLIRSPEAVVSLPISYSSEGYKISKQLAGKIAQLGGEFHAAHVGKSLEALAQEGVRDLLQQSIAGAGRSGARQMIANAMQSAL